MDNKRDGPFKVGDRVEKGNGSGMATVVGVDATHQSPIGTELYPNHLQHDGGPKNWWPDNQLTLISPSTEPQAQEETRMKAFMGIIWGVDKDKNRMDIARMYGYTAYADKKVAEMEMWADFKASNKGAELKDYEVEVHPFGG